MLAGRAGAERAAKAEDGDEKRESECARRARAWAGASIVRASLSALQQSLARHAVWAGHCQDATCPDLFEAKLTATRPCSSADAALQVRAERAR